MRVNIPAVAGEEAEVPEMGAMAPFNPEGCSPSSTAVYPMATT